MAELKYCGTPPPNPLSLLCKNLKPVVNDAHRNDAKRYFTAVRRLEEAQAITALRGQAETYRQAYVTAHAAQTATGPDAAARSEAATARLEDFESLSTSDALRCVFGSTIYSPNDP